MRLWFLYTNRGGRTDTLHFLISESGLCCEIYKGSVCFLSSLGSLLGEFLTSSVGEVTHRKKKEKDMI